MRKFVAKSRTHLLRRIQFEIEKRGPNCDLNFIDVSHVRDMRFLFCGSAFNGDISKWDVSNVLDMNGMFQHSKFNGDISQWNVSHVLDMRQMFLCSDFNGDISKWNPISAKYMYYMFERSKFTGDISNWAPAMKRNYVAISSLVLPENSKTMKLLRKQQRIEQIKNEGLQLLAP